MIVVSDTSAITNLHQIRHLFLLQRLFSNVVIPFEVYNELIAIESQKILFDSEEYSWIEVKKVSDKSFVQQLEKILDRGESNAIVLAKELNANLLLIDEWKGRIVAMEHGLQVTGIIGVLLESKRQQHIQKLKPLLDELIGINFRISSTIYNQSLQQAGEL